MKQDIAKLIADTASEAFGVSNVPKFSLEDPPVGVDADVASNVAFSLVSQLKKSAQEIAPTLAQGLKKSDLVEKVQVAGKGFLNIKFGKAFLSSQAAEILSAGKDFGHNRNHQSEKARVEFVSANPTGPLHIGNARGGPLGDVIASVLEAVGYKVLREYLHNDVGGQVRQLGETLVGKGSQYQGDYINELKAKIKITDLDEAGQQAVEILFKEIIADCQAMGIEFDKVYKESDFAKSGETQKALEKIKSSLKQKEGATWFAPSDEFLKDRETVVVKSDRSYTYFANDIAYHDSKFANNPDLVIDVLGANHHGHVPRLQAVVKALGCDVNKLKFVLYQFVRVKRGQEIVKMSKRAGTFVTAREVLDEVGKDAFRFFLLMHDPNTHLDFDLELAKKKSQENPVYYVQYAAVRTKSILRKAGITNHELRIKDQKTMIHNSLFIIQTDVERRLLLQLLKLPDLVEELATTLRVHQLTQYAIETARRFHDFYETSPVIEKDQINRSRLAIVQAALIVIENTLALLGVSVPDKM